MGRPSVFFVFGVRYIGNRGDTPRFGFIYRAAVRCWLLSVSDSRHGCDFAFEFSVEELSDEFSFDVLVDGVIPEVVDFVGVGLQVEQLAVGLVAVEGDFIAFGDEGSQMYGCELVAVFDDSVVACGICFSSPYVQLVDTLHGWWRVDICCCEKSWREVYERLYVGVGLCCVYVVWESGDERNFDEVFVVECAFGDEAVLAEEVAVVGGEDDQCIIGDAQFVEFVKYFSDFVIHEADHAVVDCHLFFKVFAIVEVAVEAVVGKRCFTVGRELVVVWLLGELVVWGHGVEFACGKLTGLHVIGVVHRGPGFGYEVGRVWIVKA